MVDDNPRGKDDIAVAKLKAQKKEAKRQGFWGNARTIIEAVLIAVVIHTFLFRPFYIPSGSMKPNLLIGDYLIINKFSYGYSKHSCYFAACPIKGRIFGTGPDRGDVAVFANPHDGRTFVKRTIGIPGDTVQMKDGILYINGEVAPQVAMEPYAEKLSDYRTEPGCISRDDKYCYIEQSMETLPNGLEHSVFNQTDTGPADNTELWTIPPENYFMMGDNRDNSNDSRMDVGLVPAENFIGKASLIVFSSSGSSILQFWKWRSGRFFQWVK